MVVHRLDKALVVGSTPTRTTILREGMYQGGDRLLHSPCGGFDSHPFHQITRSIPLSCKNDDGLNLNKQMMLYDDIARAIFYSRLVHLVEDTCSTCKNRRVRFSRRLPHTSNYGKFAIIKRRKKNQ